MTNHETPDRREQIRRVLAEADGFDFASLETHDDYRQQADAILALFEPELLRAQAEAHQYRTALQGVARKAAVSVPPPAPRADDRAAFVAEAEAKLTAGCPDHGPNGGWLMTCQCEAIGVLRDLAAEAQTTTKPETAADRAALRRQFGDVLRHWGLLDEQIDQKAAEEYAVTDLLALLPEQTSRDAETEHLRDRLASCRERVGIAADKAIAAEDAIARARRARRRLTSALIAVEPLLAEPYPDDPRWTPWTRFVGPALKELSDALKTGPAANDEPPAAGVRQDGAQA